eukprot:CAMPEP_0201511020 /NCGR_PEP_ID=MMETSP0161_2-20130828/3537_1 /ASSEMBLY_ACC=CAM_ASM_000251 /TAXON_ID=180227 /ORGANISM="Neoparamoeba aestuarina, Strain SoJaBio B1-5/56/2" /LENGTH=331 /DNA_ID=CAMNT_0047906347 /DNA_START=59 /DNA_END=1054 /DNA_ORIENTATION=+
MVLITKLTKALGIRHPIIQGGMHHVGFAELAAAVSNAGGLGIVTALTQKTPEDLLKEIQKTRQLTDKPFGVNFTIIPALKQFDFDGYAQAIMDGGVNIIETAGSPQCAEYWQKFKQHDPNTVILHKCVSTRHALKAEKMGCDFISLDGFECAGHPGEEDVGNFLLQALGQRRLSIPYICSGGVGNGVQLAAALALGAEGVNMGTRFMATKEAPIQDGIKQALVEGDELRTKLVMRSVRNTERVYRNETAEKVLEAEKLHPGDFSKIADLVRGDNYRKSFHETGNTQDSVWSAGMVMGLIDDVPSCEELLEGMVKEAEDVISNRLQGLVAEK